MPSNVAVISSAKARSAKLSVIEDYFKKNMSSEKIYSIQEEPGLRITS